MLPAMLILGVVVPGLAITYVVSSEIDHPARWAALMWMVGVTVTLITLAVSAPVSGNLRGRASSRGEAVADAIRRARPTPHVQSDALFRPEYPWLRRPAIADDLDALTRLHQAGELTDQEFSEAKGKLLKA